MKLPYEYIETEDFEKGFADYYKHNIVPLALKHEPGRKSKRWINVFNVLLAIALGSISVKAIYTSAWFIKSTAHKKGNILLLPPIFFWWLLVRRPRVKYFTALKIEVLPKILAFFGAFHYLPNGSTKHKISFHYWQHSMEEVWVESEDLITFKKDGITVQLFERTSQGIYKFSGKLFILLQVPNRFSAEMLIFSKPRYKGDDGKQKKALSQRDNLFKIEVEHQAFNKLFNVYTSNGKTARQWLNAEFINELLVLDSVFEKKGVTCSIRGRELLVELETEHNLFEVARCYDNPIVNASDIKKLLKETDFIMGIVNRLCQHSNTLNPENALYTDTKTFQ